MNALRELRPNAWIAWGGLFLAAFCGIYDTLLWYVMSEMTGPMIVNAVVLNAAAITLAALDIYTKRTRSDAEASAEPQAVETQSGAEAPRVTLSPPLIAEWFVAAIIPKHRSESVLGDLAEWFHKHVETRGLQRARALDWAQALRSILPIVWAKARKLGLIAAVAEIWRRSQS